VEIMTQVLGRDEWIRWPTVLRGILGAICEPARCVVLYAAEPQEEREQLVEATLLLHRIAGRTLPVVVAAPAAPGSWRSEVRIAGITSVWTVRRIIPIGVRRVRLELQGSMAASNAPDDAGSRADERSRPPTPDRPRAS
jgi:hypothetical protein